MKKIATYWILLLMVTPVFCLAQNSESHKINIEIPEVALLGLVSDGAETLNLNAVSPAEAGNSLEFNGAQNKNIWINYSSVIAQSNQRRKVVAVVQGQLPEGVRLMVEASEVSGLGKGNRGASTGFVTLSNQPSDVIVDIGSCYTGKGSNNGRALTYKLEMENESEDYALLTAEQTSINVLYTLTDQN
jgi:hypothetical protein